MEELLQELNSSSSRVHYKSQILNSRATYSPEAKQELNVIISRMKKSASLSGEVECTGVFDPIAMEPKNPPLLFKLTYSEWSDIGWSDIGSLSGRLCPVFVIWSIESSYLPSSPEKTNSYLRNFNQAPFMTSFKNFLWTLNRKATIFIHSLPLSEETANLLMHEMNCNTTMTLSDSAGLFTSFLKQPSSNGFENYYILEFISGTIPAKSDRPLKFRILEGARDTAPMEEEGSRSPPITGAASSSSTNVSNSNGGSLNFKTEVASTMNSNVPNSNDGGSNTGPLVMEALDVETPKSASGIAAWFSPLTGLVSRWRTSAPNSNGDREKQH